MFFSTILKFLTMVMALVAPSPDLSFAQAADMAVA
jgi:hypothetical protein